MEKDQEFVQEVVKMIVDNPKDVKVERSVDEMGVLLTLHVHSDDMGKVIGKEGQTAKALRTLLRVFVARNNERVNLKIAEPENSERAPRESHEDKQVQSEEPMVKEGTTEQEIKTDSTQLKEEPVEEVQTEKPNASASDEEEKVTELI